MAAWSPTGRLPVCASGTQREDPICMAPTARVLVTPGLQHAPFERWPLLGRAGADVWADCYNHLGTWAELFRLSATTSCILLTSSVNH